MYKNILLAYDFENSFTNVPKAIENLSGGQNDATVTIYNVISDAELQSSVRYDNRHVEDLTDKKKERLQPFVEQLQSTGVQVNIKFSSGPIRNRILGELGTNKYDVVVMSNKRDKANLGNVLGNVTHKVANNSPVPVHIVN